MRNAFLVKAIGLETAYAQLTTRHQLGIYAEPGLRYYLKNNSKVNNFFKDQPFNWTLQVGIRLNLDGASPSNGETAPAKGAF